MTPCVNLTESPLQGLEVQREHTTSKIHKIIQHSLWPCKEEQRGKGRGGMKRGKEEL